MTRINDGEATMYTRVTKDQFEIRDGAYTHTPTGPEFAPNPNSEGSMLIYTGNIGSKLASGELFAYAEVLEMMGIAFNVAPTANFRDMSLFSFRRSMPAALTM